MANKMIANDGVRYELSPVDWKPQQQILSRAKVVKDEKAPQVTSVVKPVATAKTNTTPEKLTDDVVKSLIGHTNVVYYNFETNAWNTNTYNGYSIKGQDENTRLVKKFKVMMEKYPNFRAKYEMVAPVTMTIDTVCYRLWFEPVTNPQYSRGGTSVVGNIIVRNKKTGAYELYGKSWISVLFNSTDVMCNNGAYWFAAYCESYEHFREALLRAHTR